MNVIAGWTLLILGKAEQKLSESTPKINLILETILWLGSDPFRLKYSLFFQGFPTCISQKPVTWKEEGDLVVV